MTSNLDSMTNDLSSEALYVKLSGYGYRGISRLELPAVVGAHGDCDVIFNAPAFLGSTKILYVEGGELYCSDLQTNTVVKAKPLLRSYGVKVRGPFFGNAQGVGTRFSYMHFWQELKRMESHLFQLLPAKMQAALGGSRYQSLRVHVSLCVAVLLSVLGLQVIFRAPDVAFIDRSEMLINVPYASVYRDKIGSVPDYQDFKYGASFEVTVPEPERLKDQTIRFSLGDNDSKGELVLITGQQKLFESQVEEGCLSGSCVFETLIPQRLIPSDGRLILRFIHQTPDSAYTIGDIYVDAVQEINAEEKVRISSMLVYAERAFGERLIDASNLLRARQELSKARRLLLTRSNGEELAARARKLSKDVENEIQRSIDTLWFAAHKHIQLGEDSEAVRSLNVLLSLLSEQARKDQVQHLLHKLENKAEL